MVHSPEEVAAAIRLAQDGGRMIIGDTVTVRLAEDAGLKGLLITSGPESVSLAFDMAANLLRGIQRMRDRQEVVEHSLHALGVITSYSIHYTKLYEIGKGKGRTRRM